MTRLVATYEVAQAPRDGKEATPGSPESVAYHPGVVPQVRRRRPCLVWRHGPDRRHDLYPPPSGGPIEAQVGRPASQPSRRLGRRRPSTPSAAPDCPRAASLPMRAGA